MSIYIKWIIYIFWLSRFIIEAHKIVLVHSYSYSYLQYELLYVWLHETYPTIKFITNLLTVCKINFILHCILTKIYLFTNYHSVSKRNLFHIYERKVVAFDVLPKNDGNNLAMNALVVFGILDLNEGHGYDPSTGIFRALASGMCLF